MRLDRQTAAFIETHRTALEAAPVRHNLLLTLIDRAVRRDGDAGPPLSTWSLGPPGACALRLGAHNIVLGDLDRDQCAALARTTANLDYPGVIGPDHTADWFAEAARGHGLRFATPIPQRLYALSGRPRSPGSPGAARVVTAGDAERLAAWFTAFVAEVLPHETPPPRAEVETAATSGNVLFWEADGEPVSMAQILRETGGTAAISFVFTPPAARGRGFAGAVTAAAAEEAFRRGRDRVCLYADLRNPASNRCYLAIGFAPVCDSAFWPRELG